MPETQATQPHSRAFATCLMNVFRLNIGFAYGTVLERAGCRVSAPQQQTQLWPARPFGWR